MPIIHVLHKTISLMVASSVLFFSLYLPAAQAAIVSTDQILNPASSAKSQLHNTLQRLDVQQALIEQGVNPLQVSERVNAMSDTEAESLAAQLDELPAGAGGVGTIVFLFLVLLVTDILCLTDIFPFVKKQNCK